MDTQPNQALAALSRRISLTRMDRRFRKAQPWLLRKSPGAY
jgi:hypothetical protein